MQTSKATEYSLHAVRSEFDVKKITSITDTVEYIRQFYGSDIIIYESFFLLLLDRQNNTIGYAKISQGGICGTVVDVKLIAKYIVDSLASSIIIAHNHPSGGLKPSEQDIQMTKKIQAMVKLLDCQLLDHVILTDSGHYSFANEYYDF